MGIISTGPGSPLTVSSASGGKFYAYPIITESVATQVAPANPARQQITFHNPGSNDILIYPQFVVNTGSNAPNPASTTNPGGAYRLFALGGTWTVSGECQGAWFATGVGGSTNNNQLTVIDSNV